jgi:predicted DNA-binding WGR domain protein
MKNYFEYQDDKSSKFWEITIDDKTVTTRYGKIGTTGQTANKTFESVEKAEKEYNKLVVEKTKKGYIEIEKLASENFNDVIYDIDNNFKIIDKEGSEYMVFEHNCEFSEDIVIDDLCALNGVDGVIFKKNLILNGSIFQDEIDFGPDLLVIGNLTVTSINKGGSNFLVKGDLNAKQTIYGYYNHGKLTVEGNTKAEVVFAEDHYMIFKGTVNALVINTGTIEGAEIDFYTTEPLVPELIKEDNEHYSESELLCEYIQTGKSILKEEYLKQ